MWISFSALTTGFLIQNLTKWKFSSEHEITTCRSRISAHLLNVDTIVQHLFNLMYTLYRNTR